MKISALGGGGGIHMKRFVLVAVGLVIALAAVGTATASPNKTTSINVTLTGAGCGTAGTDCGVGGGGSCLCFAAFWNFAGRTNLSPPFGSFALTGLYQEGYVPTDPVIDPATYTGTFTYYRNLELTFTAANGDKLVLVSSFSSTTAPASTLANGGAVTGTWTVDSAKTTGRYRRVSGSGTYRLSATINDTYETFTVGLAGSLTLKADLA
jgi:hypothetical protein